MPFTRREFLGAAAAATAAASAGFLSAACDPDGGRAGTPARPRSSSAVSSGGTGGRIRIPTDVGTFDALTAGPRGGDKVLLLHGFPEFGNEWSAQLGALAAAGFHAVAPDQRGYSPGVRPAGVSAYHLDHPVRDVVRIADALGWDRFDLVGHDWGACVAWLSGARNPARVRSVTAISVPHPAAFALALRTDPAQQKASRYMDAFRAPSPGPENRIRRSGTPRLPGVPDAKVKGYFRRLTTEPGALTAALNWYRANDFTGFEHDTVGRPTLFVSADDDPLVAPSGVAAARRWVTGSYRHRRTHRAGHNLPETRADLVSALLLDQLRRR